MGTIPVLPEPDLPSAAPEGPSKSADFVLEIGCEELPPEDVDGAVQQLRLDLRSALRSQSNQMKKQIGRYFDLSDSNCCSGHKSQGRTASCASESLARPLKCWQGASQAAFADSLSLRQANISPHGYLRRLTGCSTRSVCDAVINPGTAQHFMHPSKAALGWSVTMMSRFLQLREILHG